MKHIWWIRNDKGGSLGAWLTQKEARDFIRTVASTMTSGKWSLEKHEIVNCPTCGMPAEKDLVQDLGECLTCDNMRLEAEEMRNETISLID